MSKSDEELIKARKKLGGFIIENVSKAVFVFEKETNVSVEQIIIDLQEKRVDIHYGDPILNTAKQN